jgi:hypothetical protein
MLVDSRLHGNDGNFFQFSAKLLWTNGLKQFVQQPTAQIPHPA